jgi:hypothetical protein
LPLRKLVGARLRLEFGLNAQVAIRPIAEAADVDASDGGAVTQERRIFAPRRRDLQRKGVCSATQKWRRFRRTVNRMVGKASAVADHRT